MKILTWYIPIIGIYFIYKAIMAADAKWTDAHFFGTAWVQAISVVALILTLNYFII